MVLKKIGGILDSPLVAPALAIIGLTEIFGFSALGTNRDNKAFIRSEKVRLEKIGAPKDSLKRFDTHGLNIFADANDAFDIKAYGQRVDSASAKVAKVVKRAADSTEIAKIAPQATPAQICTTLTRLGR